MKDLNNDKQIKEMLVQNHQQDLKDEETKQDMDKDIVEMFKLSLKMSIIKEL